MTLSIVGLDLSLTATGYAGPDGEQVIGSDQRGIQRLIELRDRISSLVIKAAPRLVMIEGYSFSSRNSRAHALGELGGLIRVELFHLNLQWINVPPTVLKMYATGRGNANKSEVLAEAIRRLGFGGHDDNTADALWLRALGMAVMGCPVAVLPTTHMRALDKLDIPTGII